MGPREVAEGCGSTRGAAPLGRALCPLGAACRASSSTLLCWNWDLVPLWLQVLGGARGSLCQRGREKFTLFFLLLFCGFFFSCSSPPLPLLGSVNVFLCILQQFPLCSASMVAQLLFCVDLGVGEAGAAPALGLAALWEHCGAATVWGGGEDLEGAGSRGRYGFCCAPSAHQGAPASRAVPAPRL